MSNNPYNSTEDHGKSLFEKATDIVRAGMKENADRMLEKQKEFARKEPRITDEQIAEFLLQKYDTLGWVMDAIGQHASWEELSKAVYDTDEAELGRIVLNAIRLEVIPAMAKEL